MKIPINTEDSNTAPAKPVEQADSQQVPTSAPLYAAANDQPTPGPNPDPTPDQTLDPASSPIPVAVEEILVEDGPVDADPLVDDIVEHESDELLAAHDAKIDQLATANQPNPSPMQRVGEFFQSWWGNSYARYATVAALFVLIGLVGFLPTTRYTALNLVGVRSAASLTILDNTTQLPLKNVTVALGKTQAKTNQDGVVKLSHLPLGSQQLILTQRGFATITKNVTLGLGSNPLGEFTLQAVGLQYRFRLTDFLSGKPVKNGEASLNNSNAQGDDSGLIVLTLDKSDSTTDPVKVSAEGYRAESIKLDAGTSQSRNVVLTPAQQEIFVSKQTGKYDVYKIDVDGKNKQVLLAASGNEDADMSLATNDAASKVALVSKRDNTKNQDGFPLQALTIIDVESGNSLNLDHSESIRMVDWIGSRLIYYRVKAGTSAGNPERYQLMSYDVDSAARVQLAAANYFTDVVSVGKTIYYAANNNYQGGNSQFVKINPDATGRQVLLDKTDIWTIDRTSYNVFTLAAMKATYSYKIGDPSVQKTANTPPTSSERRGYADTPSGKQSVWADTRDGKGTLLVYDVAAGKDKALLTQSGLTYPLRWLNDHDVVYRIATTNETADYIISVDGGSAKKITDLTNTGGVNDQRYR